MMQSNEAVPSVGHLPTIKQIRYLSALATHRHFGRAAEACAVTQSAFSAGIKDLETLIGTQLVDRSRQPVDLTPAGLAAAARADSLLCSARDLVAAAQASAKPGRGRIRLGLIPTIAPYLLAPALGTWGEALPDLIIDPEEDLSAALVEGLRQGRLDAAILALPYPLEGLTAQPVFNDPLRLVLPADHPLAAQEEIPLRALNDATLLRLAEGHCLGDHVLAACGREAGRDAPGAFAASVPTLVALAKAGRGVTVLPELAVQAGVLAGTDLVARQIEGAPMRRIALVRRDHCPREPAWRLMASTLAKRWQSHP